MRKVVFLFLAMSTSVCMGAAQQSFESAEHLLLKGEKAVKDGNTHEAVVCFRKAQRSGLPLAFFAAERSVDAIKKMALPSYVAQSTHSVVAHSLLWLPILLFQILCISFVLLFLFTYKRLLAGKHWFLFFLLLGILSLLFSLLVFRYRSEKRMSYVVTKQAVMRSGPGTRFATIAHILPLNEGYTLARHDDAHEGGYYKVYSKGAKGWLHERDITVY